MRSLLLGILAAGVIAAVGFAFGSVLETATEMDPSQADVVVSPEAAGVYECPGGDLTAEYQRGSRVFAVGRSGDGAWIQVRDLDEPARTAWMPAVVLEGDSSFDQLPVTTCQLDGVTVITPASTTTTTEPTTTTTESTTTTTESTTTSGTGTTVTTPPDTTPPDTTPPDTTPPDTTPPDIIPPKLSNPIVDENKIWEEDTQSLSCGSLPRESVITVTASDEQSGIAFVRADWAIQGSQGSVTMTRSGSTYSGTFGPFPYLTIPDSTDEIVTITVTARDTAGNQTTGQIAVRLHSLGTCFG
jgi:hypothetical protein